jgi:hypothetical protein
MNLPHLIPCFFLLELFLSLDAKYSSLCSSLRKVLALFIALIASSLSSTYPVLAAR